MSKAEELLDSLSIEDIQPFTSQPDIEGHIVIDKDRIIHVPTELKRIAVQYDANIETVTFDCPRYWDEHDLSEMNIYINYKLPGNLINNIGQSLAKNVRINEDDENIINFDWTIGPILTNNKGDLPFSVCAKSKTNQDSDEAIRWYTEINTELTISEGMDGSGDIEDNYEDLFPDVINDIISKLDGINATYDEKLEAFNTNATSKTESFDTNAETRTTEFNNNASQKTLDYNNNCTSKTDSFNQNSVQKVTEFNDNYTSKLNSFNSNADSRIEEFDTHADLALSSIAKNNAEGTDNTFDDGLESPLYDLAGDGKSEQVVTQGYQLVDWKNAFSKSTNVSFDFINDVLRVYGVSGTEYQSVTYNITDIVKNNPGKTINYKDASHKITNIYAESMAQIAVRYSDGTPNFYRVVCNYKTNELSLYKIPEDVSNINRVDLSIFTNNSNNTNVNNAAIIEKPLLYFDNNIYEPYTGGQPTPSSDYPQEINSIEDSLEFDCRGKNLYNYKDKYDVNSNYQTDDDGWITLNITNDSSNLKFYNYFTKNLNLKASTNYNVIVEVKNIDGNATKTSDSIGICSNYPDTGIPTQGQMDDNFTLYFANLEKGKVYNKVIKSRYNCNDVGSGLRTFIGLSPRTSLSITFRISVVEDISIIPKNFPYEPYIEPNEVTFNLNDEKLRSVGDVKDELVVDLDTGDYYKVENVGENIFDGDTNFTINSPWNQESPEIFHAYAFIDDRKPFSNIIMNYFSNIGSYDISKEGFFVDSRGKAIYLFIKVSSLSSPTIESLKSWLSEHNTIVNYVLQTPTTKKLGTLSAEDLAKLKTFKGYNNVTVNTNLGLMNIRFTYGLDIKKYVDKKLAEISAQLIKGE